MAIQPTALDAAQVQSRVVSTLMVPAPPVAGAEGMELVAETWHFDPVGAVTETDVEPHRAARNARRHAHHNGRARISGSARCKRPACARARESARPYASERIWPSTSPVPTAGYGRDRRAL